ncbi:hypothetical protein Tco_0664429 [Tanacetum coccineum]
MSHIMASIFGSKSRSFMAMSIQPQGTSLIISLRDKSFKESYELIEDLTLYDSKSGNDPRDFVKPIKEISFPQDVPSTSNRRLIKLENQVQCFMEAHLAPKPSVKVNNIASSCEIYSVRKEDESKETRILESSLIDSDDRNFDTEDEKTVENESKVSKIIVKEGELSDIGNDNKASDLEDEACKDETELGKEGEWMKYEQPLDLVNNVEANINPSLSQVVFGRPFMETTKLILDREKGLITFTDRIKEGTFKTPYRDPAMDDLTSEEHDLLSSRVILSDGDVRRGCKIPLDLENGFYKEIDKLGPSYSWKIKRLDLEAPFESEGSRTSEGVMEGK